MILVHRYGLRPTRAQHRRLEEILTVQRELYNAALQERRDAWRLSKTSISYNDQTGSLTAIRHFDPRHADLPHSMGRWTLAKLRDAFTGFFGRVKAGRKAGFPRFRSAGRWNGFGMADTDGCRLRGNRLFLKGVTGALRLNLHRSIAAEGRIKRFEFVCEGRRWFVCVTIEIADTAAGEQFVRPIGVDVGIAALATLSDGTRIANIRPRRQAAKQLTAAQRALARCRRGSKRRAKVRARLARLQARVRDVRTNHLHHAANAIIAAGDLIAVEDLKLRNMTRSAKGTLAEPGRNVRQKAGLNRSMADAAPGRLIAMVRYKAERAGGLMIAIDPRNTSRTCSGCGVVDASQLVEPRRYRCRCGLDLDRDHNAAIVIKERGIAAHAAGTGRGNAKRRTGNARSAARPGNPETQAALAA